VVSAVVVAVLGAVAAAHLGSGLPTPQTPHLTRPLSSHWPGWRGVPFEVVGGDVVSVLEQFVRDDAGHSIGIHSRDLPVVSRVVSVGHRFGTVVVDQTDARRAPRFQDSTQRVSQPGRFSVAADATWCRRTASKRPCRPGRASERTTRARRLRLSRAVAGRRPRCAQSFHAGR
jgi:hypothetical protein